MQEVKSKIREFLSLHVADTEWRDDQDILAGGQVASLFVMELVIFLEEEFQIQLDDADLVLDNFATIDSLADLVARKRSLLQP